MAGPDYEAVLRRRRFWGVPPDVVERLATDCRREQTELRARVTELEGRLARATTERDEAHQTAATVWERVARLEHENQEIANRPETIREEAVRFVVDAWTEAQTLRAQTRQEIEAAETKAREELAVIRRASVAERARYEAEMVEERARYAAEMAKERQRSQTEMTEERQRYETEIAALRERRLQAIAELESLAAGLLGQVARGASRPAPAVAETAVPVVAPPPATAEQLHAEKDAPAPTAPPNDVAAEDQMLAKALDDLEAILNTSRKSNGG